MIPPSTPLFEIKTLTSEYTDNVQINEWYAYVDDVLKDTVPRCHGCKELLDYNIEHLENLSIPSLRAYTTLLRTLKKDLYEDDFKDSYVDNFTGIYLNRLYQKTEKTAGYDELVWTNLVLYCSTSDIAYFITASMDDCTIEKFYGRRPFDKVNILNTWWRQDETVNDELLFLIKHTFKAKHLGWFLEQPDDYLMLYVHAIDKFGVHVNTILDQFDTNIRLEVCTTLNSIINRIAERDLNLAHTNYPESAKLIQDAYAYRYPSESAQFKILDALNVDHSTIWNQIKTNTGIIEDIKLPELNI